MTRPTARPTAGARKRVQGRRVGHGSNHAGRAKRRRMGWRARLILAAAIIAAGLWTWAYLARRLAPQGNTQETHFDAIVVLGDPADKYGNPTPTELARVSEAVREYERGVAEHLIFSGGAVHNQYVEAEVMARTAEAQGIPASAIVLEPRARSTMENACFAVKAMKARRWASAEVISNGWQLGRAGLIFSRLPIAWRVHAAPPVEPVTGWFEDARGIEETLKTVRYLVWARPMGQWDQCD